MSEVLVYGGGDDFLQFWGENGSITSIFNSMVTIFPFLLQFLMKKDKQKSTESQYSYSLFFKILKIYETINV